MDFNTDQSTDQYQDQKKKKKKKILIISGVALAVIIIAVSTVVFIKISNNRQAKQTNALSSFPSKDDLSDLRKIQAKNPPKSYLMTFKIASTAKQSKLVSIKQYKRVPAPVTPQGDYTLYLGDSTKGAGYVTHFSLSIVATEPIPTHKAESAASSPTIAAPPNYSILVPWFPEKTKYSVKAPSGKTIIKGTIKNVQINN